MANRIALFNNQGGNVRLPFYAGIATELRSISSSLDPVIVVWSASEVAEVRRRGEFEVIAYDEWVKQCPELDDFERDRIVTSYPEVIWGEVIATERSFTDYSVLLGSAGDRKESLPYVMSLLHRIIRFFEYLILNREIKAFVTPTADTLFTLVGFKVASHFKLDVVSEAAAWLIPSNMTGAGFLTSDEFMFCPRMHKEYLKLCDRTLSECEIDTAQELAKSIMEFRGKTSFIDKSKGKKAGYSPVSPNLTHACDYVLANYKHDKKVIYTRFNLWEKIQANAIRILRKITTKTLLGTCDVSIIPEQSIFFALQYQPEQSTLTQANWYANQISVVEYISRSLPPGYTLIVKEHPWGRGNRPVWQYKHIRRFYNVIMCDAPSKEIIAKVKAVIALSGTVAIESLVMDCPTVLLGRAFFDYSKLFYKIENIQQLPSILKLILIYGERDPLSVRQVEIARFLLSYQAGLIPAYPLAENAKIYAIEIARELILRSDKWKAIIRSEVNDISVVELI